MVLRGVLERSFGNFLCLRGYARLEDLSLVSQADENYQRTPEDDHVDDVVDFLDGGRYTFFPELILGASLSSLELSERDVEEFYQIAVTGYAFKFSNSSGVSISTYVRRYENPDFPWYITASIYNLDRIAYADKKPFTRIDGNHRLDAVDKAKQEVRNYLAPFCIVLFRNDDERLHFGTVFFHNINYRARPIPEEHNLKVIFEAKINDDYVFQDLAGEASFGKTYHYARKFLEWVDFSAFPYVEGLVKDNRRTIALQLFKELTKRIYENEIVVTMSVHALPRVEMLVRKYWKEEKYDIGLIVGLFYFAIANEGKDAETFAVWTSKNDLSSLQGTAASDVIDVFEKTHKRGPYQVFVAMPYVSHPHVNEYNKLFKEVLDDLSDPKKDGDGIKYELRPIMRFRGAAQRIDRRLIEEIKRCDIFIADITGNNENVIFEVGLAEGNGKPMLLIRSNDDAKPDKVFVENEEYVKSGGHVPFDMDKLQYIPYSATGYYNSIKSIVRNHLPEIAKKIGVPK